MLAFDRSRQSQAENKAELQLKRTEGVSAHAGSLLPQALPDLRAALPDAREAARFRGLPERCGLGRGGGSRCPLNMQAKLEVGAVDDPLEHEADAVAEQVMRMSDGELGNGLATSTTSRVQRACMECEEDEEDSEKLQRDAVDAQPHVGTNVGTDFAHQLARVRNSGGRPLPEPTRSFMQPRFGVDFGGVRVHTGADASELTAAVQARAFTLGSDVFFRDGTFEPGTRSGQRLLAHELTHVVQQGAATHSKPIRRSPDGDTQYPADFLFKFRGTINDEPEKRHRGVPRVYYSQIPATSGAGEVAKGADGKPLRLVAGTEVDAGQLHRNPLWRAVYVQVPGVKQPQILWALNEYISKPEAKAARPAEATAKAPDLVESLRGQPLATVIETLTPLVVEAAVRPGGLREAQAIVARVGVVHGEEAMMALGDAISTELNQLTRFERIESYGRVEMRGRVIGLFPHVTAPLEEPTRAALEAYERVAAISDAFLTGFREGVTSSVTGKDLERLGMKLAQASMVNALSLNTILAAGMIKGFVVDVWDTIVGLIGLVEELPALLSELKELIVALIQDNEVARQLGVALGQHLGKEVVALSNLSPARLAFRIGELVGPLVIWTVLSIIGIGEVAAVAKAIPGVKRVLEGVRAARLLMRVTKRLESVWRGVVRVGRELHHLVFKGGVFKLCSPGPCSVIVHDLKAVLARAGAAEKGPIEGLIREAEGLEAELAQLEKLGKAPSERQLARLKKLEGDVEAVLKDSPAARAALVETAAQQPVTALVKAQEAAKAVVAGVPENLFRPRRCTECARAIVDALKRERISGELLTITANRGPRGQVVDFIVSDLVGGGTSLTQNGLHQAVRVGDIVFDNYLRQGVPYKEYVKALRARFGVALKPESF